MWVPLWQQIFLYPGRFNVGTISVSPATVLHTGLGGDVADVPLLSSFIRIQAMDMGFIDLD